MPQGHRMRPALPGVERVGGAVPGGAVVGHGGEEVVLVGLLANGAAGQLLQLLRHCKVQ